MVSRPMCGRLPVTCPPPRLRSSRGRPMSNDPTDYRREINRDLDPDEYEAVMFKYEGGQKWHAVAGEALAAEMGVRPGTKTMCGLRNLTSAEVMWERWILQPLGRCRRCERAVAVHPEQPHETTHLEESL